MLQEARPYANNWHVKYYFPDEDAARHLFIASGRLSGLSLSITGARRSGATVGRDGGNGQVSGQ
jgi:hypothetical protein